MKKFFALILICTLCLVLCACGQQAQAPETDGGVNIVATVFPAYDFARQIAGDDGNVTLLIPPGSEVHSYEPTPQDIIRIQNCDLLVCNGGESEAWLDEILGGMDREIPAVVMLDCVDALTEEVKEGMQVHGHDHGHDDHDHDEHDGHDHDDHEEHEEEYDEHVWTSPVNAQLICRAISAALCQADPAHASDYTARCVDYCAELQELDADFRGVIANAKRHTLIFADRFPVRYFVEEYGLDYFAAFPGCADDAEPSARTVAFLIDRVREEQAPAVLYIEFSNQKMADIVCEDTGCEKLLFNSCHNVTADQLRGGVTYLELMRGNLETVKEALG